MMRPMPAIEFPRHHVGQLRELGARLLDSRKVTADRVPLARDLLAGFQALCMRAGLDRVLLGLALAEGEALADRPALVSTLAGQLGSVALDDGGPRNAKPGLLADAVVAALELTLVDEPDRTIMLDDHVRVEVLASLAAVVDVELAVPRIREAIITEARAQVEERYRGAFERIAAQLDERGMRVVKQPKVAIDAVQAVQQILVDTRNAIIGRVASAAIDRAKPVLARASADAAARIDLPISLALTPRAVAILRACDARITRVPPAIVESVFDSLTELARLAWKPLEHPARAYGARETFAVGEVVDHPKFGRGTVTSVTVQRIEVEFPDDTITLVHARK